MGMWLGVVVWVHVRVRWRTVEVEVRFSVGVVGHTGVTCGLVLSVVILRVHLYGFMVYVSLCMHACVCVCVRACV